MTLQVSLEDIEVAKVDEKLRRLPPRTWVAPGNTRYESSRTNHSERHADLTIPGRSRPSAIPLRSLVGHLY